MNKLFTSSLEVAILEHGPVDGCVVFLLHGFPDDAAGLDPVMNVLADQGIRTPYMIENFARRKASDVHMNVICGTFAS